MNKNVKRWAIVKEIRTCVYSFRSVIFSLALILFLWLNQTPRSATFVLTRNNIRWIGFICINGQHSHTHLYIYVASIRNRKTESEISHGRYNTATNSKHKKEKNINYERSVFLFVLLFPTWYSLLMCFLFHFYIFFGFCLS